MILGVRSNEFYFNIEVELEIGDRVLMRTDGIIEASNESEEFFGETRLKETIAAHERLTADGFATMLLEELSAWTGRDGGAAQADVITLVVIDVERR